MILVYARLRACVQSRNVLLPALLWTIGGLCALPATGALPVSSPTPARHVAHNQKQELYFERRYGIGQLRVHSISSGASVEFRCQVLDTEKAKALKDTHAAPVMIERKTGTKLSVAATDNNGKPPQSAAPEAGQEYQLVFGNRGKIVKPGNLVDVVIGTVHMSGLIVE
jgi:hypothetical protein